jgi:membrane-bound serine protease (ClpP class)
VSLRLLIPLLLALVVASPLPARAADVYVVAVEGGINPAISDHLEHAIQRAERDAAAAIVIELDTPGGLGSSTKDIVSAILNARVPVIVYVSPRGAWAASAGTFITLAGHVAAMAPGSSIGAASPVPVFGAPPAPEEEGKGSKEKEGEGSPFGFRDVGTQKAENYYTAFIQAIAQERKRNVQFATDAVRSARAITAKEALEMKVVDLLADDLDHLLEQVHGRKVRVGRRDVQLDTRDASVVRIEMELVNRLFDVISDPQIALLLILAGLLGLYVEFTQPGLIFPGLAGLIALLLAGFALQVIPFNWIGLILITAGIALLVAEVFVSSFGALFAGGIVCLAAGAYLLFDVPEQSDLRVPFWTVVFPTVAAVAIFCGIVVFGLSRSLFRPQFAGAEAMVGALAVATSDIEREGRVFLHGEIWTARSDAPVKKGDPVEITGVEDLVLRVRPRRGPTEGTT